MLGRRGFLGGVGAAAAGAAVSGSVSVPQLEHRPGEAGAEASAPGVGASGTGAAGAKATASGALDRLGVTSGARFATCTVQRACTTDDGAIAVTLTSSGGDEFQVELLGHDAATPGVARAGSLAVYMNNRGRGVTATVEEHGLAAMALASHIAHMEAAGIALPSLPTLNERRGVAQVG